MPKIKYTIPCYFCFRNGESYLRTVRVRSGAQDEPNLFQKQYIYVEKGKCPKCGGTGTLTEIKTVNDLEIIGKDDKEEVVN